MEIMTPLAISLFWSMYFNLSSLSSIVILIIGGLATLFRGIKIGFMK